MGSFSNTVFSILLGWLQVLVSMIWSALTAKDGHSFLQFLGNHWILIVIILCMIGLSADFAVYLFRWQPYKVWKTFLNRIRSGKKAKLSAAQNDDQSEETFTFGYTDDSSGDQYGEIYNEKNTWHNADGIQSEYENTPVMTKAGYTVPPDSPYRRPENRRRNRIRMNSLLGDDSDSSSFHYSPPQPMIDQKDAYHTPVYPEKWTSKRSGDNDT